MVTVLAVSGSLWRLEMYLFEHQHSPIKCYDFSSIGWNVLVHSGVVNIRLYQLNVVLRAFKKRPHYAASLLYLLPANQLANRLVSKCATNRIRNCAFASIGRFLLSIFYRNTRRLPLSLVLL